ncbi:hypothetical protein HK102_005190 [Quaeritorhiza haematococci]|nr:hypothetical protein HK102_005190 [Quaeritorhiza haematococci]
MGEPEEKDVKLTICQTCRSKPEKITKDKGATSDQVSDVEDADDDKPAYRIYTNAELDDICGPILPHEASLPAHVPCDLDLPPSIPPPHSRKQQQLGPSGAKLWTETWVSAPLSETLQKLTPLCLHEVSVCEYLEAISQQNPSWPDLAPQISWRDGKIAGSGGKAKPKRRELPTDESLLNALLVRHDQSLNIKEGKFVVWPAEAKLSNPRKRGPKSDDEETDDDTGSPKKAKGARTAPSTSTAPMSTMVSSASTSGSSLWTVTDYRSSTAIPTNMPAIPTKMPSISHSSSTSISLNSDHRKILWVTSNQTNNVLMDRLVLEKSWSFNDVFKVATGHSVPPEKLLAVFLIDHSEGISLQHSGENNAWSAMGS